MASTDFLFNERQAQFYASLHAEALRDAQKKQMEIFVDTKAFSPIPSLYVDALMQHIGMMLEANDKNLSVMTPRVDGGGQKAMRLVDTAREVETPLVVWGPFAAGTSAVIHGVLPYKSTDLCQTNALVAFEQEPFSDCYARSVQGHLGRSVSDELKTLIAHVEQRVDDWAWRVAQTPSKGPLPRPAESDPSQDWLLHSWDKMMLDTGLAFEKGAQGRYVAVMAAQDRARFLQITDTLNGQDVMTLLWRPVRQGQALRVAAAEVVRGVALPRGTLADFHVEKEGEDLVLCGNFEAVRSHIQKKITTHFPKIVAGA